MSAKTLLLCATLTLACSQAAAQSPDTSRLVGSWQMDFVQLFVEDGITGAELDQMAVVMEGASLRLVLDVDGSWEMSADSFGEKEQQGGTWSVVSASEGELVIETVTPLPDEPDVTERLTVTIHGADRMRMADETGESAPFYRTGTEPWFAPATTAPDGGDDVDPGAAQ